VNHERVYLKACDSVSAACVDIAEYMRWYNRARAYSGLAGITSDQHCFATLAAQELAA
jgi:Integrase core domain